VIEPAPKANFMKLFVNDEYFGLYNSTETIDERFLKQYFGTEDDVLVKCDPEWQSEEKSYCPEGDKASLMYLGDNPNCYFSLYEMKSDTGWKALINLAYVLNQEPDRIVSMIDAVDENVVLDRIPYEVGAPGSPTQIQLDFLPSRHSSD